MGVRRGDAVTSGSVALRGYFTGLPRRCARSGREAISVYSSGGYVPPPSLRGERPASAHRLSLGALSDAGSFGADASTEGRCGRGGATEGRLFACGRGGRSRGTVIQSLGPGPAAR